MTGTHVITGEERRGDRAGIGCLIAMLVLIGAIRCPADILNPSFEMGGYKVLGRNSDLVPLHWRAKDNLLSFNSYPTPLWATEGMYSAGLFNRINRPVNAGSYQSFWQNVDLTGVGSIEFDVQLVALPAGGEFANFEASFLIDNVVVWRQTAGGIYLNQRVDVSGLAGSRPTHLIEIRNTALVSGTFGFAYWTLWDNLRLVQGPATIPAVIRLDPGTLNLGSEGKWVTCYIELGEDDDDAVRRIDGASVKLNDIPAYMGEPGWATPEANEGNVADFDGDGILERMVKFDRAAVQALVQPPEATVTITGRLNDGGVPFEGSAVIQVLDKGGKKK